MQSKILYRNQFVIEPLRFAKLSPNIIQFHSVKKRRLPRVTKPQHEDIGVLCRFAPHTPPAGLFSWFRLALLYIYQHLLPETKHTKKGPWAKFLRIYGKLKEP